MKKQINTPTVRILLRKQHEVFDVIVMTFDAKKYVLSIYSSMLRIVP